MALTEGQKLIAATLVQKKPEVDYMIQIANDNEFATSEIAAHKTSLKEELLKEKENHENHIVELNSRLEKINALLSALEE